MSKEFEGLDIENMFAEAVGASENTGEKDPAMYGKNPKKDISVDVKTETQKSNIEKKTSEPIQKETKEEIKPITQEIKSISKEETKSMAQEAERTIPAKIEISNDIPHKMPLDNKLQNNADAGKINIVSITRIIEMKEILDNYSDRERTFIQGYFQQELGSYADIIYSALTSDKRGLEAINKIVIAREHSSAERAFYLMELSNNNIEAMYEQINLLTGELDDIGSVADNNKIQVCRILEGVISKMDNNVFLYINKLQEFANKTLF